MTTTGNVIFDLLHNFHLECGVRLHKLRVYESLSDPTRREVCGYLLVRGSVHAHAFGVHNGYPVAELMKTITRSALGIRPSTDPM